MKLITVIGLLAAIFQTALRAATLQEVAPLAYPRVLPRSEMMADGRILVLGGYDESGLPVATVEIFNPGDPSDPTTSSWTPGPVMNEARYVPTLTRLKNGKFLVTGGYNGVGATATVEIYDSTVTDPLVNPWSYAAPMLAARYTPTPPRSCPMAGSWSPAATTIPGESAARRSMIRSPTPGHRPGPCQ